MDKRTLISTLLLLFSVVCLAQLRVTNDSKEDIRIAIGYNEDKDWCAEGWWQIKQGDTKTVYNGILKNRYYYYYAYGKNLCWQGKTPFHVDSVPSFKLKENMINSKCLLKNFRIIDIADYLEYTIVLTSPSDFPDDHTYPK
jgi:uncharacterized membrane protein